MSGSDEFDPFDQQGAPALSFKDLPVGTMYRLRAVGKSAWVQSRNYDTGEPEFWDGKDGSDGQPAQPKMCAVVQGTVIEGPRDVGEERSVWATKPSSMFEAFGKAQKNAGVKIDAGVEFAVEHLSSEPNKDRKKADIKKYAVTIFTPAAGPGTTADDPPF